MGLIPKAIVDMIAKRKFGEIVREVESYGFIIENVKAVRDLETGKTKIEIEGVITNKKSNIREINIRKEGDKFIIEIDE